MPRTRILRRLTGWVAAISLGLALLLPTLVHALARVQGPGAEDICSAAGTPSPAPQGASHALLHGLCCPLQAPQSAPPPAGGGLVQAAGRGPAPEATPARPAPRAQPWTHARPRAPPRRA